MIVHKLPKSIYVAGPMTGYINNNVEEFRRAEKHLRSAGWKQVVNPGSDEHQHFAVPLVERGDMSSLAVYDLTQLLQCEAIYMLRGWQRSVGARAEHATAVWAELHFIYQEH